MVARSSCAVREPRASWLHVHKASALASKDALPSPDFAKVQTLSALRQDGRQTLRSAADFEALDDAKAKLDGEKQVIAQLVTCLSTACKELQATATAFKGNVAVTLKKKKAAQATKKKKKVDAVVAAAVTDKAGKKKRKEAAVAAAATSLRDSKASRWPSCFKQWSAPVRTFQVQRQGLFQNTYLRS